MKGSVSSQGWPSIKRHCHTTTTTPPPLSHLCARWRGVFWQPPPVYHHHHSFPAWMQDGVFLTTTILHHWHQHLLFNITIPLLLEHEMEDFFWPTTAHHHDTTILYRLNMRWRGFLVHHYVDTTCHPTHHHSSITRTWDGGLFFDQHCPSPWNTLQVAKDILVSRKRNNSPKDKKRCFRHQRSK